MGKVVGVGANDAGEEEECVRSGAPAEWIGKGEPCLEVVLAGLCAEDVGMGVVCEDGRCVSCKCVGDKVANVFDVGVDGDGSEGVELVLQGQGLGARASVVLLDGVADLELSEIGLDGR